MRDNILEIFCRFWYNWQLLVKLKSTKKGEINVLELMIKWHMQKDGSIIVSEKDLESLGIMLTSIDGYIILGNNLILVPKEYASQIINCQLEREKCLKNYKDYNYANKNLLLRYQNCMALAN